MTSKDIQGFSEDEEELVKGEEELFEDEGDEDEVSGGPALEPSAEVIRILPGEALTAEETDYISSKSRTRVIMLAGAPRSGKTTLAYCLFLCFQNGPFANYLFAGSRTLMGLERRCWRARTVSMGKEADTLRTEIESQSYLHLTVRKKDMTPPIDIIFCDLSGEIFKRSINSTENCSEVSELNRIDHLVILIDGNKLRRLDLRNTAQHDARLLLRSFIDSKAVSHNVPVEIVFTKIDLFDSSPPDDEKEELKPLYTSIEDTRSYLDQIKKEITQEFANKKLRLRFFETVARMDNPKYELGYGVESLLQIWAEELPSPQPRFSIRPIEKGEREIDMFLDRELRGGVDA